jgi:hypothetical protein
MTEENPVSQNGNSLVANDATGSYWAKIKSLECLADAYIRETGLPASKICLVQEKKGDQVVFYYRPLES